MTSIICDCGAEVKGKECPKCRRKFELTVIEPPVVVKIDQHRVVLMAFVKAVGIVLVADIVFWLLRLI